MRGILASMCTLAICGALAEPAPALTTTEVKRVVDKAQASFQGQFNPQGMAIVVVAPDGDALRTHTFTYGTTDVNRPRARVRPSTLFEIGSVTKVFTAALLTDAVARKVVTYTQKAQTLMPEGETLPKYPESGTGDDPCSDGEMNLRQLAGHTAGFEKSIPGFGDSLEYRRNLTPEKLFDATEKETLQFCPGHNYKYSNTGFGLLGTLLAIKQSTTYAALIADLITKPLRMNSTRLEKETSRLSRGYNPAGGLAGYWFNVGALAGGGGLMSSVTDMGRFVRGQLGQGPSATVAAFAASRTQTVRPSRSLAWTSQETTGLDGRYYYKNGGTKGFSATVAVAPDESYGVAVLVNRKKTEPDKLAVSISEQLLGVSLAGGLADESDDD